MMYEKVVLPTDGSKCAIRGVKEGLEMARTLGVEAVAIYVIDTSEFEGIHHSSIKESARQGLIDAGKEALDDIRDIANDIDVKITTRIEEGKPYKEITKIADENDVIYISSHGLSGWSTLFMGSTTEKVLKNSKATVSVVMRLYTKTEEKRGDN